MTEKSSPEAANISTGELRHDLQLISGEPDRAGKPVWMLFDPVADSYYRVSDDSRRIISMLDRSYPLDEFCRKLAENGCRISGSTVLETLNFLKQNNLLVPDPGSMEKQYAAQHQFKKKSMMSMIAGWFMFFRIPPLHPGRFFSATGPLVDIVFNNFILYVLAALSIFGYILLVKNWEQAANMLINSLTWGGMVKYSLAIVCVKIIHELSHAYTASRFGIRVRAMGICFIFLIPRLFTDLTDSWRLSRKQRLMIDSAGIASELLLGGIAALVWGNVPPGPLHSTMFFIFAVSVINSLLINGNPFIRYDGYYILSDILNTENLMQRSQTRLRYWWMRTFFGIGPGIIAGESTSSNLFLLLFGIGSFIYRLFLYFTVIAIIFAKFTKAVAIVLFIFELWFLVLFPLCRNIAFVLKQKEYAGKRKYVFFAGCAVILLILTVPLPLNIAIPCEVRPLKATLITVETNGYIMEGPGKRDIAVKRGGVLLKMSNPLLELQLERLGIDSSICREELEQMRSDPELLGQSRVKMAEYNDSVLQQQKIRHELKKLEIFAPVSGQFINWSRKLYPGMWLEKGQVIGELAESGSKVVAYVTADKVDKLEVGDKVSVRLDGELKSRSGRIANVNTLPAVLHQSPLVNFWGGPISCYNPDRSNTYTPILPHYKVIVDLEDNSAMINGRCGTINLRKYTSIATNTVRYMGNLIQRELSF